MISGLTFFQEARMPEFVEKWTKIALSTEPVNRAEAEKVIRKVYACAGLKLPNRVVWFGSRHEMSDYAYLLHRHSVGCSGLHAEHDLVWGNICDPVRDCLQDVIAGAAYETIRMHIWGRTWAVEERKPGVTVMGPWELSWLAVYDYCREVLGLVKETARLDSLFEWAKTCGWICPMREVCLAADRNPFAV